MRLAKMLTFVILGLASSLAMAEEVDCSKLASPQARQQCVQHKQQNSPDCSKLASPEARQACVQQKAK